MNINYRIAQADDIDSITDYMEMASGGITEFLLKDLISNVSPKELIKLALNDDNTPYYYTNVIVAEVDNKIVGATNFYPADQHGVPDIMLSFIPKDRIETLEPFLNSHVDNSLYIHTLAVHPDYRQTAIAMDLCKCCEAIALEAGYEYISAHVWADNTPVVYALKIAGFSVVEQIDIKPHPLLPHNNGMLLLKSQNLNETILP